MNQKKTIIHIIFNLTRGGAETMLIRVVKELKEYTNIIVTLEENNHFVNEIDCDKYICLHRSSVLSLPLAAIRLKRIIQEYKPDIVHSHLPISNFIARLATPASIPLITTLHTSVAHAVDYKKWYIRLIDKLTYRYKKSTIIAVSKCTMNDYFSFLHLQPGNTKLLYTFVDIGKYNSTLIRNGQPVFKIISVGSLRTPKNYFYLLEAFKQLKGTNLHLDIYGAGPLQEQLQQMIGSFNLPVTLKGQVKNIHELLPLYDLFIMSSLYEGFSLGVLEAMASNVPLLLSDIPSFREQCENATLYFNLDDPGDVTKKILMLKSDKNLRNRLSARAKDRVKDNFTFEHHIVQLRQIYLSV